MAIIIILFCVSLFLFLVIQHSKLFARVFVYLFILLPRFSFHVLSSCISKDVENCMAHRKCPISILKISGQMIVIKEGKLLKATITCPV